SRLDLPGLILASVGLLGIVLGVVRGNDHGWTSLTVLPPLVIGALLVAGFIGWELRAREPMLPLHLFRSRGFAVTNAASLLMFFGMFGSIFLLAQFLQVVQHYSPLEAGLRTLPWTAMPVFVAPVAGVFGIAVLGAVFSARGGYASGTAFVSGLAPAVWVGGAAVAVAAAAALFLPRLRQAEASPAVEEVPVLVR